MATPTTAPAGMAATEQVHLLISGFRSFSDINAIRKAVMSIPGVAAVQARPQGPGSMYLAVTYSGMVPFQVHLTELLRGRGRNLPASIEVSATQPA